MPDLSTCGELADPEAAKPGEPVCEMDGENIDTYGGEHYWHCHRPGAITVDGTLLCEDHAGEQGYGPKQEEYGYDPDEAGVTDA